MKRAKTNFFSKKVTVIASGLNLESLIIKLHLKGITLFDVKLTENLLEFKTFNRDLIKVKRQAQCYNISLKIIDKFSYKSLSLNLLKNSGIAISVCFWAIFSIFFQKNALFVTASVNGNQNYEIANFAQNCSYSNLRELERKIEIEFSDVENCTVTKKGVFLNIECSNKFELKNKTGIVAPCDLVITKINVISGEQKYFEGDLVKEGSVIVAPNLEGGVNIPAKAEIFASGWVVGNDIESDTGIEFKRTGKTAVLRCFSVFGHKFLVNKPNFALFETETCEHYISPNNFLPIKIVEVKCFELEQVNVVLSEDSIKLLAKEKAKTNASSLVPESATNISEVVSVISEKDCVKAECYLKFDLHNF